MNNYIADGKTIDTIADKNYLSGDVVKINELLGIAVNNANIGDNLVVRLSGVYTLPKESYEMITAGDKLYWIESDKAVSVHKTDNFIGHAFTSADNTKNVVSVKLAIDGIRKLGRTIYVNSIFDFPEPVADVINLQEDYNYIITADLDITPYRINCLGICAIFGISSETSFLRGEVPSGSALITSNYSLPIQNISIEAKEKPGNGKGDVFNIDGLTTAALDWDALNILDSNVGVISDVTNLIITNSAWLNSGGLNIDGSIGTIGISNSLFVPSTGQTSITILSTATITRRFRVIYSAFVILVGNVGLNVSPSANISAENYILDTVNFSGGGTYLSGLLQTDKQTLFSNCTGIDNTANVEYYYFRNNASSTIIGVVSTPVKIVGTTLLGLYRQGFTHTSDNKSTFNRALPRFFKISINYSCTSGNNNQIKASIYKTGILSNTGTPITTNGSGRAENGTAFDVLLLSENDYIEVFIQNDTATNNIVVTDLDVILEALN